MQSNTIQLMCLFADAVFTIPLYTVVLAALYQGGLLLLIAAMPIAFMVAVAFLMTWLVLIKRYMIPSDGIMCCQCITGTADAAWHTSCSAILTS